VIGVTGATGYLGRSLIAALRESSLNVVEYRRTSPNTAPNGTVRALDLSEPIDTQLFEGVSCVVHTAWDLRETDPRRAWECNVNGSKRLLEAALGAGVQRFIFISSMSAYFGTKQDYGLMKLAVERAVLESNQIVVRPGLVYGGDAGGMVLTLTKLARLPLIPVFRDAHQFTLHINDFLAAMVLLVRAASVPSSVIGLAYESPTPFKEIMQTLAAQSGSTARTVTVPWHPLLGLLRVGERLRIPLPVRSDSLLGLVRPAPVVPGHDVAASIGLSFRGFSDNAGATPPRP
jgi:nucleoside-diphosphate-sugar epimerase